MSIRLSATARTILRARLRRSDKFVLIQQAVEGTYGARNISDLTNTQLIELAHRFQVPMPTDQDVADYDRTKSVGPGEPDSGRQGAALFTDEPQAAEPEQPEAEPEQPQAMDKIAAAVAAVREPLGTGDYPEFERRLAELAEAAHREPVVVYQQQGTGRVAKPRARRVLERKQLDQFPIQDVAPRARALAVYDATDIKLDDSYHWHPMTGAALAQLARGKNAFLVGPKGSGKTTWAQQLAARLGRPFVRISCDDQTEAAQLVGMTIGKDENNQGVWQDGQLTAAIRQPGTIILIDEPSVARPGALFVLQSVLDGDRRLHIAETGEVVPVADDVMFIAADNTNGTGDATNTYEGTRILNGAFLDRFGIFLYFDYLPLHDEAALLAAKAGCDYALAHALAKVAALTRKKQDAGDLSHGMGFRRLVSLAELIADGVDAAIAFQTAVIDAAPFDDREPLRQMWSTDFKWSPTNA